MMRSAAEQSQVEMAMSFARRFVVAAWCGVVAGVAAPASAADDVSVLDRVETIGRLWAAASYLHPDLAAPAAATRWDDALAEHLPDMMAAGDEAAYAASVDDWLSELDDPATRVITDPPGASAEFVAPVPRLQGDVLFVDLRDPATWPTLHAAPAAWQPLAEAVSNANAVVFDLRAPDTTLQRRRELDLAFVDSGVGIALGCREMDSLASRARDYEGYPAEQLFATSGLERRGFVLRPPVSLAFYDAPTPPSGTSHPYSVFLVARETPVPLCAVALATAGKAALVADRAVAALASQDVIEVRLGERHSVRIRTSQGVTADGSDWPAADLVVRDGAARARAIELARGGPVAKAAKMQRPPLASTKPPTYPADPLPNAGLRVLAVARMCFAFEHFFPYRRLSDDDWRGQCRAAYADAMAARDADAYRTAIGKLLTATHDSHVGLLGESVPAALGPGTAPVSLRAIERRFVVDRLLPLTPEGITVGEVLVTVDGISVDDRIARLRPLLVASTPQWEDVLLARQLLAGPVGTTVRFELERADGTRHRVETERKARREALAPPSEGEPAFRLLAPDVGYADLSRLTPPEVASMFDAFASTRAIVFDMRGYPKGTAWDIAPRLTDRRGVPAATFMRLDLRADALPSLDDSTSTTRTQFVQTIPDPVAPTYRGETLMLIDGRALSQAEHTGLFLRAANGTRFVGSPTGGANGNVTNLVLPGGLTVSFSGLEVQWPDGTALQRRGLQPDIVATPTLSGFRAGRDEVLEAALRALGVEDVERVAATAANVRRR